MYARIGIDPRGVRAIADDDNPLLEELRLRRFFELASRHGVLCLSKDALTAIKSESKQSQLRQKYWFALIKQCHASRLRKQFAEGDIDAWLGATSVPSTNVMSIDDLNMIGPLVACRKRSERATIALARESDQESLWCDWLEPLAANHTSLVVFDHWIGIHKRGQRALGWLVFRIASMDYAFSDAGEPFQIEVLCGIDRMSEKPCEYNHHEALANAEIALSDYLTKAFSRIKRKRDVAVTLRCTKDWGRSSSQKDRWLRFHGGCYSPGASVHVHDGIDRLVCDKQGRWTSPLSIQFTSSSQDINALRAQEETARKVSNNNTGSSTTFLISTLLP